MEQDLWDYQDHYNLESTPDSLMAKQFSELNKKFPGIETKTNIVVKQPPPESEVVKDKLSCMAIKYRVAWKKVYNKLPEWRKKEIDNQLKSGMLSDKNWDTNFVRQVASLAESDDPQEAG